MKNKSIVLLMAAFIAIVGIFATHNAEAADKKKVGNSKFDESKVKLLTNKKSNKKNDYILFKNGKKYYYDGTNKEIEDILKSSNSTINTKSSSCPPPGLSDCSGAGGWCWCRLSGPDVELDIPDLDEVQPIGTPNGKPNDKKLIKKK